MKAEDYRLAWKSAWRGRADARADLKYWNAAVAEALESLGLSVSPENQKLAHFLVTNARGPLPKADNWSECAIQVIKDLQAEVDHLRAEKAEAERDQADGDLTEAEVVDLAARIIIGLAEMVRAGAARLLSREDVKDLLAEVDHLKAQVDNQ